MKKSIAEKNYYQLLCVDQDASPEQITKAFRDLERIYGPDSDFFADIVADPPRPEHHEIFARIKLAFNTLMDPEKRRLYDESLSRNIAPSTPPPQSPAAPGAGAARQGRILSAQGAAPVRPAPPQRPQETPASLEHAYGAPVKAPQAPSQPPPQAPLPQPPPAPPVQPQQHQQPAAPQPPPRSVQIPDDSARMQKATMYFPPTPGNPITEFRKLFFNGTLPTEGESAPATAGTGVSGVSTSSPSISDRPLSPPVEANAGPPPPPANSASMLRPPPHETRPAGTGTGTIMSVSSRATDHGFTPSGPKLHHPAEIPEPVQPPRAPEPPRAPPPARITDPMTGSGRISNSLLGDVRRDYAGASIDPSLMRNFGGPPEEEQEEILSVSEMISISRENQWRGRLRWLIFLIVFQALFLLLILVM